MTTVIVASAMSVLAHLVLWPIGDSIVRAEWGRAALPSVEGMMEVSLIDGERERASTERDRDALDEVKDKQLVKLDVLADERVPDRETPYVSEFDNRAERPTRAPKQRPIGTHAAGGLPQATPQGADRASRGQVSTGEAQDRESENTGELANDGRGTNQLDASAEGELAPRGGGSPSVSLNPRGLPGLSKSLREEWGRPGTLDALPDDLDEGAGNLLDTQRFKYASFFNRVRDQIAGHWDPQTVHTANDPDGRRYGSKTRTTDLLITLNPDGSLHHIRIVASSHADHLDREAIRAVRAAAPFSNPPPQLVDERGVIEFHFGFILEMGGSGRIFRYRN